MSPMESEFYWEFCCVLFSAENSEMSVFLLILIYNPKYPKMFKKRVFMKIPIIMEIKKYIKKPITPGDFK